MPDSASNSKFSSHQSLTALVAGGAGFLGSHLCETLLSQNIRVIAVDNLHLSGRDNLKGVLPNPHFSLVDYDLNSNQLHLAEDTPLDYIFHVAGVEERLGDADLSLETLLVNSLGTKHLLDLARDKKAKFLLVSSADIYSGALSSTSLTYYFGRHVKDERILTHHEAKRYAEALTFEYFKKYNLDARICRVLDVYGPRLNLESGTTLNTLVKEALRGERLTIEGDGLRTLHPTYVNDVVYGLVKAVLLEGTKGKIFNLINPEKITLLTLVEEFKKAFAKNFDLVFKKDESTIDFPYHTLDVEPTVHLLSWKPKISLVDGLIQTSTSFRTGLPPTDSTPIPQSQTHHPSLTLPKKTAFKLNLPNFNLNLPSRWKKRATLRLTIFLASSLLLLVGVFYPTLSFFINLNSGQSQLQALADHLQKGEIDSSLKKASQATSSWSRAGGDLRNLTWLLSLVGQREKVGVWSQEIFALTNLAQASHLTIISLEPLRQLLVNYQHEQKDFSTTFKQTLSENQLNLSLASDRLAVAKATLFELERKGSRGLLKERAQTDQLVSATSVFGSSLKDFYSVLPETFGLNEPQNYLIVETDNTVLKSSGGVLKNYLLIGFENGAVKKHTSGSFSALNAQTPDTVAVPAEIRSLHERANFELGDSVWEVDLPSASQGLKSAFAQRGQPLSAVLFLDKTFLDQLGSALAKKIELTSWAEVSKQLTFSEWGRVFSELQRGESTKHAATISFTPSLTPILEQLGWSGEVEDEKLLAQKELNTLSSVPTDLVADYLQVVTDTFSPSSIQAPKINYTLAVNNQGLLEGEASLTYSNQTRDGFSGYSRVLVPLGSVLETRDLADGSRVVVDQKFGKTQFGFPIGVSPNSTQEIKLRYQIPIQVSRNKATTYSILIAKQLGTASPEFTIRVQLPPNIEASPNESFQNSSELWTVQGNLETDKLYFLEMKRS